MANKCKICGCELYGVQTKIKGGALCYNCISEFPLGIQHSASSFTLKQLLQIKKIIKRARYNPDQVWRSCGTFKVCSQSIILNAMEYKVKDLRSIRLNFHPKDVAGSHDMATGYVTLVIETKSPHVMIEERFLDHLTVVRYTISGLDITYHYSAELEYVVRCVQTAIKENTPYIKDALKWENAKEAEKRRAQRAQQEQRNWQQKERAQQNRTQSQSSSQARQEKKETPLEAALRMYGLKQPYTVAALKARRNNLLKTNPIHPDNGGTNEKFKEFQLAYELLLQFATK